MADIKTIENILGFLLIADLTAILTIPPALMNAYILGMQHESGIKNGRSGVGLMWTFISKIDLRDLYFGSLVDKKIAEKYGLTKYYQS